MKKLSKKDLQFRKRKSETLYKPTNYVNSYSFVMRNLEDCKVFLPSHTSTVYIDDCINCQIYLGPTESSVFIRDCSDCTIATAAQQVRISDSKNLQMCVFSSTDLTLENARAVALAPYNFVYPGIGAHFDEVMIDTSKNQGFQVMDFDKEYGDDKQEGENYYLIKGKRFEGFKRYHDGMIAREFPDDERLSKVDFEELKGLVEDEVKCYPIEWPEIYGGKGEDPATLNSQIQFKESEVGVKGSDFIPSAMANNENGEMKTFRMDVSPILTNRKFFQKKKTQPSPIETKKTEESTQFEVQDAFIEVGNSVEQEIKTSERAIENEIKLKPLNFQKKKEKSGVFEPPDTLNVPRKDYEEINFDDLSRLDSEQSITKQFGANPQFNIMLESESESEREIDINFIKSKLSINQRKVLNHLEKANGDFLLKALYKRSLSRVEHCKMRNGKEKRKIEEKRAKAKKFVTSKRDERKKNNELNESELLGKRIKHQNSHFNGNVWEGLLLKLEEIGGDKKFIKQRTVFKRAIQSKMSNF